MPPKRTENTQGSLLFMMMGHRLHTRVSGIDRPYGQSLWEWAPGARGPFLLFPEHIQLLNTSVLMKQPGNQKTQKSNSRDE